MKDTQTKSPAFQFYPGDFLSDPKTLVMSAEEIGVYWLLICACWKDDGLPKELKKLSQLARVQEKKFTRLWNDSISYCFYFDEISQRFKHTRLDQEFEKQALNSRKRKEAAEKRWSKSDANALQTQCKTDAMQCLSSSSSTSSSTLSRVSGGLTTGDAAKTLEEYQEPIRAVYGTNTLGDLQRWESAFIRADAEKIPPAELAQSLRELLAQDRKYPVTPENAINRAIEKRAKQNISAVPKEIPNTSQFGIDYAAEYQAEMVAAARRREQKAREGVAA